LSKGTEDGRDEFEESKMRDELLGVMEDMTVVEV